MLKRIVLILVAVIISLMVLLMIVLNSSYAQEKIIGLVTDAISKELNTELKIEHVGINLLGQRASFYDVSLKDQQRRDMLRIGEVWVNVKILPLLRGKVVLKELKVSDVDMLLIKPEDGPANYQFLTDALNTGKPKPARKKKDNSLLQDMKHAEATSVHVRYNDDEATLDKAVYDFWRSKHTLTLHHLQANQTKPTKKDTIDWHFDTGIVTATMTASGKKHIDIKSMTVSSDNHKPRRNVVKPKRGAFDIGHMNLTADMGIDILHYGKDTLSVAIIRGCAKDTLSGIDLTDLRAGVTYGGRHLRFTDAVVQQITTRLDIPVADFTLPDRKDGSSLRYKADSIKAHVMLKDISKAFAPVLKHFSLPLNLRVNLSGTTTGMLFKGIHVNTDDKKFTVNATGILSNLDKGRELNLHFDVHDMVAKPGIKDKIINQFTVKKYMMYQLYALGLVKYRGDFDILWHKEKFRGKLETEKGDIEFSFQLDENTHYVTGRASTDSLKLGELFQLKRLGKIDCTATFNIDYSKKRTAEIRKQKGGKLPIGQVNADIRKVGYRSITMKNILTDITSDGAVANGSVTMKGNLTDLMLEFSFTNTTEMHKMKVKPRLKFHKILGD